MKYMYHGGSKLITLEINKDKAILSDDEVKMEVDILRDESTETLEKFFNYKGQIIYLDQWERIIIEENDGNSYYKNIADDKLYEHIMSNKLQYARFLLSFQTLTEQENRRCKIVEIINKNETGIYRIKLRTCDNKPNQKRKNILHL